MMKPVLLCVGEEAGFAVEEGEDSDNVAIPLPAETVALLRVFDAETVAPEGPIVAPGATSGESPTPIAWIGSQLPSDVTSMRAQCWTRVPEGTGFGNDEGGRVVVQLYEYSDQGIHSFP